MTALPTPAVLEGLHRSHDGPLPRPVRLAARHGSAEAFWRAEAAAHAAAYNRLCRDTVLTLARQRRTGMPAAILTSRLNVYRSLAVSWHCRSAS